MQIAPVVRPRVAPILEGLNGPIYRDQAELEDTVKWLENLHKVGLVVAVPLLAWVVWKVSKKPGKKLGWLTP